MTDEYDDNQPFDVMKDHYDGAEWIESLIDNSGFSDEEWAFALQTYGIDLDIAMVDPVARAELKRLFGGGTEGLTDHPSDDPDDGAPPP